MKKLVMLFGLLVTSSAFSMEFSDIEKITPDDECIFTQRLARAMIDCKNKIEKKTYAKDNSMCLILNQLFVDVACKVNNNIKIIIKTDSFLSKQIKYYQLVDSNPAIQHVLKQVRNKQGDVEKAKEFIIQNRRVLAELRLQECHPAYSPSLIGEEMDDFMQRNAGYPMNEGAVLDYKALYIYLALLADKVD
jgi:hypothetical protein